VFPNNFRILLYEAVSIQRR